MNSAEGIEHVKCVACKARLEGRKQANGQMYFACPKCGVGDTLDKIQAELVDQAKEKMRQVMLGAFRKTGSKWKVTESVRPKRRYRFFVDLKAIHGGASHE